MRGRASVQFWSIECYPNNTVGTDRSMLNFSGRSLLSPSRRLLGKEVQAREDGGDRIPNMPNSGRGRLETRSHAVVLREGRESEEAEEG